MRAAPFGCSVRSGADDAGQMQNDHAGDEEHHDRDDDEPGRGSRARPLARARLVRPIVGAWVGR